MHRTPRWIASVCLLAVPTIALGADFDESASGDISSDPAAPTALGALALGANVVSGTTTSEPLDRDFITFTIEPGTALASIILEQYDGPPFGGGSFVALEDTDSFSTLDDPTGYIGTALVGTLEGTLQGQDILDDLSFAGLGGSGFATPLGPGTYTFWYQETGGPTSYSYSLNVIPTPGAAGLLACGAVAAMRRRR